MECYIKDKKSICITVGVCSPKPVFMVKDFELQTEHISSKILNC